MAMTKREREEVERMRAELRLLAALRWTDDVQPDIPKPAAGAMTVGWLPVAERSDSPRVEPACSGASGHGLGQTTRLTSQAGRDLYSTRLLALKALRYRAARYYASILAKIDQQIEAEEAAQDA